MFITCSHLRSDVLYKNESIARDEEDGTLYNKGFTKVNQLFFMVIKGQDNDR